MDPIKVETKENVLNAYSVRPTLPYDVEGVICSKEGKNVELKAKVENKNVYYSLKLKEEIPEDIGDSAYIKKENILSCKMKVVDQEYEEKQVNKIEQMMDELGIEKEEETTEAFKSLYDEGIPLTEDNISSILHSKKCLEDVIEKIDYSTAIKLMKKGIDIEKDPLSKIVETLKDIQGQEKISLKDIIFKKRSIDLKDAEEIAVKIYGRTMGKDIYDSIIALYKEGMDITKENIENVREVVYKLYDLKDIENKVLISTMSDDISVNINNLYKLKHSYSQNEMKFNFGSERYEEFTITKEVDAEEIYNMINKLNIDNTEENVLIIRDFILSDVDVKTENIDKMKEMKENLSQLIQNFNEESAAKVINQGIDPLTEDIKSLLAIIRKEPEGKADKSEVQEVISKINELKEIDDKDLVLLLKKGEDFNIDKLKSISSEKNNSISGDNRKVIDKVSNLVKIFNEVGDLDKNVVSLAAKRFSQISLYHLMESKRELEIDGNTVSSVGEVSDDSINMIRAEYFKVKNSLTLNMVKESVKEGMDIELLPLYEVNDYIEKKSFKNQKVERFINSIKNLKGKEFGLLSSSMKNGLDLSLKELNDLNGFNSNKIGFGSLTEKLLKETSYGNEGIEKAVGEFQKKSKDLSDNIKEGNEEIKEKYKDLMKAFQELESSLEEKKDENQLYDEIKELKRNQRFISKEDLMIQFPIALGDDFENLQLIILDGEKGIDKDKMTFLLNINTPNMGDVKFKLRTQGKNIFGEIDGEGADLIIEKSQILKEKLESIGYNLKGLSKKGKEKNVNYSFKLIDRKI